MVHVDTDAGLDCPLPNYVLDPEWVEIAAELWPPGSAKHLFATKER